MRAKVLLTLVLLLTFTSIPVAEASLIDAIGYEIFLIL